MIKETRQKNQSVLATYVFDKCVKVEIVVLVTQTAQENHIVLKTLLLLCSQTHMLQNYVVVKTSDILYATHPHGCSFYTR